MRTDAERVDEALDLSAVARSARRLAELPDDQLKIAGGVRVRGNATMLQRMITNLLDNAIRHGAAPVLLSVTTDRIAHQAVFNDRGPRPWPRRSQPHDAPFERGDASRSKGGAGLGLAIVARVVERHAGGLEIGTADAGGTRVTVRLPLLAG